MALSQQLIDDHQGQVPNTAALVKLPGVGVKTANVVLNELFDVPTIAVDTHIFRVVIASVLPQEKQSAKWKRV